MRKQSIFDRGPRREKGLVVLGAARRWPMIRPEESRRCLSWLTAEKTQPRQSKPDVEGEMRRS
jgi:hypothetical protein